MKCALVTASRVSNASNGSRRDEAVIVAR